MDKAGKNEGGHNASNNLSNNNLSNTILSGNIISDSNRSSKDNKEKSREGAEIHGNNLGNQPEKTVQSQTDVQESVESVNSEINSENDSDEEDKADSKKQIIFLFGTIMAIIIIIALLFIVPRFFIQDEQVLTTQQRDKLVEEMHQKNKADNLPEDEGILYNEFSFVYYKPFKIWNLQVYSSAYNALFNIYVHFNPLQISDIPVTGLENLDKFYEKTLNDNNGIVERIEGNSSLSSFSFAKDFVGQSYIVYDPGVFANQGLFTVIGEITTALGQTIGVGLVSGCTSSDYGCGEFGNIISCDSTDDPVIYLKYSEETSIDVTEDCVTISGNNIGEKDLMKAVDKFIFLSLRVMNS